METRIIRSNELNSAKWDGGTTTQLFIFPQTAEYSKRNFQFRLSTATVEIEQSDFTSLPGFSRKLMVLDGGITLIHENHHTTELKKFDVDTFEGDWKTTCIGKCTDFNLMTTDNLSGELKAIEIKQEQQLNYKINDNLDWFFVYVYNGSIEINIDQGISKLDKGDLLVMKETNKEVFEITGIENAEFIISEINADL